MPVQFSTSMHWTTSEVHMLQCRCSAHFNGECNALEWSALHFKISVPLKCTKRRTFQHFPLVRSCLIKGGRGFAYTQMELERIMGSYWEKVPYILAAQGQLQTLLIILTAGWILVETWVLLMVEHSVPAMGLTWPSDRVDPWLEPKQWALFLKHKWNGCETEWLGQSYQGS